MNLQPFLIKCIKILRSSTYLLANFSTHATVCTRLILNSLLPKGGGIMQIILTLRQCMLGE